MRIQQVICGKLPAAEEDEIQTAAEEQGHEHPQHRDHAGLHASLAVGLIVRRIFIYVAEEHWHSRRVAVWSLAFCLLMAYWMDGSIIPALMPRWATIRATSLRATMPMPTTRDYFAGLILCNVTKARKFVAKKFTITSYMVFTPVFFAGVGMKTNLRDMNSSILAHHDADDVVDQGGAEKGGARLCFQLAHLVQRRRVAVWSLAFCLLMAYCSEEWFGVADITGAYFAGLILCNVTKARPPRPQPTTLDSTAAATSSRAKARMLEFMSRRLVSPKVRS